MDPLVEELAEDAAARFQRYVRIDTQSVEDAETFPSTAKQLDLLRLLRGELAELGLEVELDEHGYVFATLPATVERDVPAIGFLAHVDTSPAVSGANVSPQRIRYEGGEIALPADPAQVIRPDDCDELENHVGHDLITTDGTTLLGADDKAGVAEIMAAVAYLVAHPEVPHGTLRIGFNPDEEVGTGTQHFDIERFGADCAYTLDGSTAGEIQDETFSAVRVTMTIRGRAIHPGTAKGTLVNAVKVLAQVVERLPKDALSPETTEEREGFVHPYEVVGDAAELELRFIARDFEDEQLDRHVELLRGIAAEVADATPGASIDVATRIQYRNMRNALAQRPEIVANAEEALRRVGLEPIRKPIRGGTDGSQLTEKGLPTPNLFTGGQLAHSEREWICVEDMGLAAKTVIELAKVWGRGRRLGGGLRERSGKGMIELSKVGLGCNNFGGRIDFDATRAVVDAAVAEGVAHFDTADVYGDRGDSERFLGRLLEGRRDEVVLATKFGGDMGDGAEARGSAEYVRRACDASLERLRTDRIDLYYYHRPDGVTPVAETLGALSELIDAGKVLHAGCSNFSAAQLREADEVARRDGLHRFEVVQNRYSLLERGAEAEELPAARELGLGFVPYFPLANGLLTGKYRRGEAAPEGTRLHGRDEPPAETWDRVEALERFAADRGRTLLELAIAALASTPGVVSVICGATRPEQVRANAAAAGWRLAADELAELGRL